LTLATLCKMGTQLPSPKGAQPPIFRPISVAAKWLMHQDATSYRDRPGRLCVRWGPRSPSPKKGAELCPSPKQKMLGHAYCCQTAGCIKMPLGTEVNVVPGDVVSDEVAAPPTRDRHSPQFSVHVYCGQTAVCMKTPLGTEVDHSPGHIVLDGGSQLSEKGAQQPPPVFSPHVYCGHGRPSQLLLSYFYFIRFRQGCEVL